MREGLNQPREYAAWRSMIDRCENPRYKLFHRYGGRGITISPKWRASFKAFFEDMGPRPSSLHSLDRINNDGNYEPSNCRWATATEQARNMSSTVFMTHDGKTMCLSAWADEVGITKRTLWLRRKAGLPVEAVLAPVKRKPPEMRGVSWHRKAHKWMAHPYHNGNMIYLGLFEDAKQAIAVVTEFFKKCGQRIGQ